MSKFRAVIGRLLVCLLWIATPCLATAQSASDASGTLAHTLAALAAGAGEPIAYHEVRESELLDAPVTYEGELQFDPTSRTLVKKVTKPVAAQMVMTTSHLVLSRPGKKDRRVKLSRRPQLRALHAGLSALLSGDLAALERLFEIQFTPQPDHDESTRQWQIVLQPIDRRLRRKVAEIRVVGRDNHVETLVTELTDGERQTMSFLPVP